MPAPKFTTLHRNPFIVGLDFSAEAIGITLNQVQQGKDQQEHRRLLYCFGWKNTPAGQNCSLHKGGMGAFMWVLKKLDSTLKIAPSIVEAVSMSVKYIHTLKTMKSVYFRWSEIFQELIFAVIHAKEVVEDCISREPHHIPEPTREELWLKQDYESDPEPMFDYEEIAKKEAALNQRTKNIWHLDEEKEPPSQHKEWNNHASRNKCSRYECSRRELKKKKEMVVGQL